MSVADAIRHRLRAVLRARAVKHERDEEIAFHQSLTEQQQRRDGADGRGARFRAKREFGNETLVKEEIRHMSALRWIDTMAQDLRYGVRTLLRSPVFTIVAVLSLALGIGANTAIFGVLHALMLRPLSVPNPEELVALPHVSREEGPSYGFADGEY
ncbi:MAG: ABC transporter permease, partial [Vicinamibacterales bacterium]